LDVSPAAAPTKEKPVLTCDCVAHTDQNPDETADHEPGCINSTLEPIDPADEYDLYARYGL
jgi:hypothetical protein